ncbi:MAG: ATP-binding protein [Cyanobacteriota bacterium]
MCDVFTPRRTEVNSDIYIDRPLLEKELRRSLEGSLHTIIYGESGSGKTWLYKKVLDDLDAYVATANCANALRFGSLTREIQDVAGVEQPRQLASQGEEMSAKVNIAVADGSLKSTNQFEIYRGDPLRQCLSAVRNAAGPGLGVLVIDNLEFMLKSKDLMNELASVIAVLDDARYSVYNIKLLLVGVPSEIKDYFLENHSSVANRLSEISEVAALTNQQVGKLVEKGFQDLLKVRFDDRILDTWKSHVPRVTMGFAQHVQEYCEQLGYLAEDNHWVALSEMLRQADSRWLKGGLSKASGTIERIMNERETKIGRRNQILFVLGRLEKNQFNINEVESLLRREFPNSTAKVQLAVGQILAELATDPNAIIKKSPKGGTYQFRDARFAMASRVLLKKDVVKEQVYLEN